MPLYMLYVYGVILIKFYALLTLRNTSWLTRNVTTRDGAVVERRSTEHATVEMSGAAPRELVYESPEAKGPEPDAAPEATNPEPAAPGTPRPHPAAASARTPEHWATPDHRAEAGIADAPADARPAADDDVQAPLDAAFPAPDPAAPDEPPPDADPVPELAAPKQEPPPPPFDAPLSPAAASPVHSPPPIPTGVLRVDG